MGWNSRVGGTLSCTGDPTAMGWMHKTARFHDGPSATVSRRIRGHVGEVLDCKT